MVPRIDATGKYTVARHFERPTGMPNLNNEGFAIAPAILCHGNTKPVFRADGGETPPRRPSALPALLVLSTGVFPSRRTNPADRFPLG